MIRCLTALLLCIPVLCLLMAAPAVSLDQVVKLYICQTEHDLEEITSWEYSKPEKYNKATKNGKLTPLDAAQESAGTLVSLERIQCNADRAIVIEQYRVEGDPATAYQRLLEGAELERYCPRTLKKYGHPCR